MRGLALALVLVFVFTLAACGIKGEPDPRLDLPEPQIMD